MPCTYGTLGKNHEDNEWETITIGIFNFLDISKHDFKGISDSIIDKLELY